MYLFECFNKHSPSRDELYELLNDYKYRVDWDLSIKIDQVNSVLQIYEGADYPNYSFRLSEFPGNCSALVVSDIQNKYSGTIKIIVDFCTKFCEKFEYALLFATVTKADCKDFLLTLGFTVLLEVVNEHSSKNNYFLVKRMSFDE